jgi:hypothetical protein
MEAADYDSNIITLVGTNFIIQFFFDFLCKRLECLLGFAFSE